MDHQKKYEEPTPQREWRDFSKDNPCKRIGFDYISNMSAALSLILQCFVIVV